MECGDCPDVLMSCLVGSLLLEAELSDLSWEAQRLAQLPHNNAFAGPVSNVRAKKLLLQVFETQGPECLTQALSGCCYFPNHFSTNKLIHVKTSVPCL